MEKINKLILIDGISGSGKSTTAKYLCHQFNLLKKNAVWYFEEQINLFVFLWKKIKAI